LENTEAIAKAAPDAPASNRLRAIGEDARKAVPARAATTATVPSAR
jgi:hypothetical protein